jgi:uncharacterized protein YidB (DUF937 family)
MGLFDSIAGAVLGNMLGGKTGGADTSALGKIAIEMLNKNGGIGGLLEKFNQGGLGDIAASWVGQGKNQSVSPDQISQVFGHDMMSEMATKFGIDSKVLTGQIAQYLPEIVNNVTPNGKVDNKSEELLSAVLGMLK